MSEVTVYGASDDLIEVDGVLREEFSPPYDEPEALLAFSDGTVLRVRYDEDGCWRITPLARGTAEYSKIEAVGPDDPSYSDRVTLSGDFEWVVYGQKIVRAKSADA